MATYGITKKTHSNGNTTATYTTDRKGPGDTTLTVRWYNPVKARRAQERTVAKAKREEARRQKAAARANRRKPYSGATAKSRTKAKNRR